jgi:hypothetical protein
MISLGKHYIKTKAYLNSVSKYYGKYHYYINDYTEKEVNMIYENVYMYVLLEKDRYFYYLRNDIEFKEYPEEIIKEVEEKLLKEFTVRYIIE